MEFGGVFKIFVKLLLDVVGIGFVFSVVLSFVVRFNGVWSSNCTIMFFGRLVLYMFKIFFIVKGLKYK